MSSVHIHTCARGSLSCEAALSSSCSLEAGSLTKSGTRWWSVSPRDAPVSLFWSAGFIGIHGSTQLLKVLESELRFSRFHTPILCVYVYMHTSIVSVIDQKLDLLKLEVQTVMNHLIWVLGTEFAIAVLALSCWVISPALSSWFFEWIQRYGLHENFTIFKISQWKHICKFNAYKYPFIYSINTSSMHSFVSVCSS